MNQVTLFADLLDADASFLSQLLDLAVEMKAEPTRFADGARGKVLYALYQKTSTRTQLAFTKAMATLGGTTLSQRWDESNFSIADLETEARYVSTTADVMLARLVRYADVQAIARVMSIPFINGCCDKFHPTQAIADLLTIREHVGRLAGVRLLYVGVLNNVFNSLMLSLPLLGGELVALLPTANASAQDDALIARASASGRLRIEHCPTQEQLRAEIAAADAVYTDTWVNMELINDPQAKPERERLEAAMRPFQLNADVYRGSQAKIMHCMPVHLGYEITAELVDHPNAVIFAQAENRMHAARAILARLLRLDG